MCSKSASLDIDRGRAGTSVMEGQEVLCTGVHTAFVCCMYMWTDCASAELLCKPFGKHMIASGMLERAQFSRLSLDVSSLHTRAFQGPSALSDLGCGES